MIAIAAMSRNRVIGVEGKLPWHLPEDLKFFKRTTLGHVILMGRKTYDSIGRPLPGRETWVLSRSGDIPGVRMLRSPDEIVPPNDGRKLLLVGGAQLYESLLPRCQELYLTLVDRTVEGDAFFPPFEDLFEEKEPLLEAPEMVVKRYVRRA